MPALVGIKRGLRDVQACGSLQIADPFFAYCKLHADKMIVRSKRRNWLALQSRNRNQVAALQDSTEKVYMSVLWRIAVKCLLHVFQVAHASAVNVACTFFIGPVHPKIKIIWGLMSQNKSAVVKGSGLIRPSRFLLKSVSANIFCPFCFFR